MPQHFDYHKVLRQIDDNHSESMTMVVKSEIPVIDDEMAVRIDSNLN